MRQFARHGHGAWDDFAVTINTLTYAASEISTSEWPLKNSVQIWFDPAGRQVVARLTVLDRIVRDVRLSSDYDGPNRTLYVLEPLGHRNRLPAVGATFGSLPGHRAHGHHMRLVETGPAPTIAEMGKDLKSVMSQSLGLDAIQAALGDGFESAVERYPTFTAAARSKLADVLVDTLVRFSHLAQDPRPEVEARTFIEEVGFETRLLPFDARQTSDNDVTDAIGHAFVAAMSAWGGQWTAGNAP